MVSALGASWGSLGTFLAHLVGLLVALGASLGASWDLLGLLGRRLVPLGASAHTVPQTSRLQDLLLLNA